MLRIGLIGAGTMGAMYARAFSQHASAELAAICDLQESRARKLARRHGAPAVYTDLAAMFRAEDLDAVAVATPDYAHRGPVIACLKAGLDVLCEKPLATTVGDCKAIGDAVHRYGRRLMVNYGNRPKPKVYALKRSLEAGDLGEVSNVFIQLREPLHKTGTLEWVDRTTPTWFLLSHCVDTVLHLMDRAPVKVYAATTRGVLAARGIDVPDSVVAMLHFEGGAVAALDANWIMPKGFAPQIDFSLELIGTEGAVYCQLRSNDMVHYGKRARAVDYNIGTENPLGTVQGWWYDSVYYFVDCIERGLTPEPGVDQGTLVTRVLLAVEESARRGRPVSL